MGDRKRKCCYCGSTSFSGISPVSQPPFPPLPRPFLPSPLPPPQFSIFMGGNEKTMVKGFSHKKLLSQLLPPPSPGVCPGIALPYRGVPIDNTKKIKKDYPKISDEEEAYLQRLENMGFKNQEELNKCILRTHGYDLDKSVALLTEFKDLKNLLRGEGATSNTQVEAVMGDRKRKCCHCGSTSFSGISPVSQPPFLPPPPPFLPPPPSFLPLPPPLHQLVKGFSHKKLLGLPLPRPSPIALPYRGVPIDDTKKIKKDDPKISDEEEAYLEELENMGFKHDKELNKCILRTHGYDLKKSVALLTEFKELKNLLRGEGATSSLDEGLEGDPENK